MKRRDAQSGATLLVTLIMLVMLTLLAISAMNTSTNNLRMIGNAQERAEALDAAQLTIEKTISTPRFVNTPYDAIANPCGGTPNTVCVDVNGDGVNDLQTTLTPNPTCIQARVVKVSELSITGPTSEDVACVQAQQQGQFAVAGANPTGDSLCGMSVWNVRAVTRRADTTATNSPVTYGATQGVAVRIKSLDIPTSCP